MFRHTLPALAVAALALAACSSSPVAAPAKTVATEQGKTVFNQNCAMCHVPGLAESPKLGDKAAWAPRLAQGKAALVQSALNGKKLMPARGGNPKLTDDEVRAAVDVLVAAAE